MKIAVGVDFSPESELAARQAVEIARRVGGEVVLVHAALSVELPAIDLKAESRLRPSMDTLRERLAQAQKQDRERLTELRERLSGQGPAVSHILAEGHPEAALGRAALELGAEMTVIGTGGRTGLGGFLLGGVAQRAVRFARNDVLVARARASGRGGFHNILVATDFTPSSIRALDRALALAAPGAEVHVVHFYQHLLERWGGLSVESVSDADIELVSYLHDEGEKMLAGRRERGGPRIVFHVAHGPPILGIVHWLEQFHFDLAALGSHGRRGPRRMFIGSVAEKVVQRAPCSVLVARGGEAPSDRGPVR